jgi:hypothetical protein
MESSATTYQLIALLLLASWAQQGGDRRPLPEAPRDRRVVRVMVGDNRLRGQRRVREIILAAPGPAAPAGEDDDQQPPQPVVHLNIMAMVVERENFDRWLFDDGRPEEERQGHLEAILQSKVELAIRAHRLTEAQRAKLRLAGRGDIKRFFDRVEERRSAFEIDRRDFKTGWAALQRLGDLSQIYHEGPFGDGSLFAKTLHRINEDRRAGR